MRFIKRVSKVERKVVYCPDLKTELIANYYTIFGIYVCVTYSEIEDYPIGI